MVGRRLGTPCEKAFSCGCNDSIFPKQSPLLSAHFGLPRFEVVYFLNSLSRREHVRLKVRVNESQEIPTLTSVFKGANWWERFVWDFYGVRFAGHPDLRRVLLYEEFQGHPLRKDYALRDRQPLIPERPIKDIFRGPGTSGVS